MPTNHLTKATDQYLSLLRHNTEKGPPNTSDRKRSTPYACLKWVGVPPWRNFLCHVCFISITQSLPAPPSRVILFHRDIDNCTRCSSNDVFREMTKKIMTSSPSRPFNWTWKKIGLEKNLKNVIGPPDMRSMIVGLFRRRLWGSRFYQLRLGQYWGCVQCIHICRPTKWPKLLCNISLTTTG